MGGRKKWTVRRPACMGDVDFAEWSAINRTAQGGWTDSPCNDCLPEYAVEMRALERCDGEPLGHLEDEEPFEASANTAAERREQQRENALERAREVQMREAAERRAKAVDLSREGVKVPAIARIIGVTPSVVYKYLREWAA